MEENYSNPFKKKTLQEKHRLNRVGGAYDKCKSQTSFYTKCQNAGNVTALCLHPTPYLERSAYSCGKNLFL